MKTYQDHAKYKLKYKLQYRETISSKILLEY